MSVLAVLTFPFGRFYFNVFLFYFSMAVLVLSRLDLIPIIREATPFLEGGGNVLLLSTGRVPVRGIWKV